MLSKALRDAGCQSSTSRPLYAMADPGAMTGALTGPRISFLDSGAGRSDSRADHYVWAATMRPQPFVAERTRAYVTARTFIDWTQPPAGVRPDAVAHAIMTECPARPVNISFTIEGSTPRSARATPAALGEGHAADRCSAQSRPAGRPQRASMCVVGKSRPERSTLLDLYGPTSPRRFSRISRLDTARVRCGTARTLLGPGELGASAGDESLRARPEGRWVGAGCARS